MKHDYSRQVYDYWRSLLGHRLAPSRSEIDPGQIRSALGNTFILDIETPGEEFFRLAGTRMCALYKKELKNKSFSRIWGGDEYDAVRDVFDSLRNECARGLITSDVRAVEPLKHPFHKGLSMEVETILLPLSGGEGFVTRCIGCHVPLESPYWLGVKDVLPGGIKHVQPIPDDKSVISGFPGQEDYTSGDPSVVRLDRRARIPAGVSGRQVGHLTVIEGGLG